MTDLSNVCADGEVASEGSSVPTIDADYFWTDPELDADDVPSLGYACACARADAALRLVAWQSAAREASVHVVQGLDEPDRPQERSRQPGAQARFKSTDDELLRTSSAEVAAAKVRLPRIDFVLRSQSAQGTFSEPTLGLPVLKQDTTWAGAEF
jgi:hypothetical protein